MTYEELWKRAPLSGSGEEYGAVENRLLLKIARQITAASDPLETMMAAGAGLGSVIATLRKHYGHDVVQADCLAEKMIAGFAEREVGPAKAEGMKLYEGLLRDLKACEKDAQTWYVMATMINPGKAERWLRDLVKRKKESGIAGPG